MSCKPFEINQVTGNVTSQVRVCCGAQPRDTNYKPISSLPPPSLPPARPLPLAAEQGHTFANRPTFDQFRPQVKFPSALPCPSPTSLPPGRENYLQNAQCTKYSFTDVPVDVTIVCMINMINGVHVPQKPTKCSLFHGS